MSHYDQLNPSKRLTYMQCNRICNHVHRLGDMEERLKHQEELLQDEKLNTRKLEVDMIAEKKRMQRTLETALAQLRNSQVS